MKIYEKLAHLILARQNCIEKNNTEWKLHHEEVIQYLVKRFMPSGSGFDAGTQIDLDASTSEKLVFHTSFHHMNEHGYYCGWTEHKVVVVPSFIGDFGLKISGPNKNQIKDLMYDEFGFALRMDAVIPKEVAESPESSRVSAG